MSDGEERKYIDRAAGKRRIAELEAEIERLQQVILEQNDALQAANEQANEHGKLRARVAELETLLRDVREEITTQDSALVIRKYALREIDRALAS